MKTNAKAEMETAVTVTALTPSLTVLSSSVSIEESSLRQPLAGQRWREGYAEAFPAAGKVSRAAMLLEQDRLLGGAPRGKAECRL